MKNSGGKKGKEDDDDLGIDDEFKDMGLFDDTMGQKNQQFYPFLHLPIGDLIIHQPLQQHFWQWRKNI